MKTIRNILFMVAIGLFTVGCFKGETIINPDGTTTYKQSGFEKSMDALSGLAGLSGTAIAQIIGVIALGAGALVQEKNKKAYKGEALAKDDYLRSLIGMIESYGKKSPEQYEKFLDHLRERMPSALKSYVKGIKAEDIVIHLKKLVG